MKIINACLKVALIALFSFFVASCSGVKPVLVPTGTVPDGVTSEQIRTCLEQACNDYDWQLANGAAAGEYIAMHVKGKHMAKVKILFTDNTYTISYLESTGLKYDEDKGVSRHYNTWVNNLNQALQTRLTQAGFGQSAAK